MTVRQSIGYADKQRFPDSIDRSRYDRSLELLRMTYLDMMDPVNAYIPPATVRQKGSELNEDYCAGAPFPHAVIDDFLPEALAEYLLSHFGSNADSELDNSFDRDQERFKSSFHPDTLQPAIRGIFYAFNSRPFIKIIENITGIKGLIPDPYFSGGGFHEIKQGGHLSMHADFNHHKMMNLERRINVLIYLNKDWSDDFGGQLELWDDAMSNKVKSIIPTFNRCVIFNTTSDSMHGNPEPINHPKGISRKSIALYYYTSTWTGEKRAHTTQFRVRAGSADRRDWAVWIGEIQKDYLPPILDRAMNKLKHRLRRP